MQKFVKKAVRDIIDLPVMALNLIKRFEELEFSCLTIDRRYLDVGIEFANSINHLKDK